MSKKQKTLVLIEDKACGDFTAFYEEIPYAIAQGKDKEEAKQMLDDLLDFIETKEDLTSL